MTDFSGDDVVERHMDRLGREPLLQTIRDAAGYKNADLDRVLKEYGELTVRNRGERSLRQPLHLSGSVCLGPTTVRKRLVQVCSAGPAYSIFWDIC